MKKYKRLQKRRRTATTVPETGAAASDDDMQNPAYIRYKLFTLCRLLAGCAGIGRGRQSHALNGAEKVLE